MNAAINDHNDTYIRLYDVGSKTALHYSASTMETRRYAQHVLLGYAVSVGVVFSHLATGTNSGSLTSPPPQLSAGEQSVPSPTNWPIIGLTYAMVGSGIILVVFASVLWVLNEHHSQAFRAVRTRLIAIEGDFGTWKAHKDIRDKEESVWPGTWKLKWAWDGPFLALAWIGGVSIAIAMLVQIRHERGWGHILWELLMVGVVAIVPCVMAIYHVWKFRKLASP